MAISETQYRILRELRERELLPQGGSILEIGQANFYGDFNPRQIEQDAARWPSADERVDYRKRISEYLANPDPNDPGFRLAEFIYNVLFDYQSIHAIDGDPLAYRADKLDLNVRIQPAKCYDVVFNHGTAEHIFNVANVFKIMHDATLYGGLMLHEAPFTGWVDHGFYCLQPTLFYDVAAANDYEIIGVWIEHLRSKTYFEIESREHVLRMAKCDQLPYDSMLFVVFRKRIDAPFKVPMQGVYTGVSEEACQSWLELR